MKISVDISIQTIRNLLCSAFEGGSNYWYQIDGYQLAPGFSIEDFRENGRMQPENDYFHWSQLIPTIPGCAVKVSAPDAPELGQKLLNLETLQKGLDILTEEYPWYIAIIINETDDAETGDVLLQCALFGDIIFG